MVTSAFCQHFRYKTHKNASEKKCIRLSGTKCSFGNWREIQSVEQKTSGESARGAHKVNSDLAEKWKNQEFMPNNLVLGK